MPGCLRGRADGGRPEADAGVEEVGKVIAAWTEDWTAKDANGVDSERGSAGGMMDALRLDLEDGSPAVKAGAAAAEGVGAAISARTGGEEAGGGIEAAVYAGAWKGRILWGMHPHPWMAAG